MKWQVDGGFTAETVLDAKQAGADIIVSGRGIFKNDQIFMNIENIRAALKEK